MGRKADTQGTNRVTALHGMVAFIGATAAALKYAPGSCETVASDGTVTSTLTAIAIATGGTAWTQTVNGRITDLRPFSGSAYAVVVVPATTSGGAATRPLIALGDSGTQLWSIKL